MATRNLVINDPVGIHARPAAMFAQAVTASGQTVTIAKEGGNAVPAGSILSIMGLGIKQGDTVVINVEGDNAEAVADNLANIKNRTTARHIRRAVVLFLIGSSRLEPVHQTRPLAEKHTGVQGTL